MTPATDGSTSSIDDVRKDRTAVGSVLALRPGVVLDVAVILAVAIASVLILVRPIETQRRVVFGASDRGVVTGFHEAEFSFSEARPFRWTRAESIIQLPAQGLSDHILTLHLSAPSGIASATSHPVTVELNATPLTTLSVTPAPRMYRLLAPHSLIAPSGNAVALRTTTIQVPGDRRDLGVVAFAATFAASDAPFWLTPAQVAAVTGVALLILVALRMIGIGVLRWIIVVLFALISLSMRHSDLRFAQRWEALLLTLGLAAVFASFILIIVWRNKRSSIQDNQSEDSITDKRRAPDRPFFLLITGIVTLSTVLLFAPFMPDPVHIVPGPLGDNLEYVWKLQWFADALVERRSPVFVPHLFYPEGYELAYSELTPAHTLLGLPLTWLVGATLTYNLLLIISTVLTALFTVLLAHRLGAGRLGAFVASIGVGFCLWRYQHVLAHMPLFGTQWIILALYGLEGFIRGRRAIDALLVGLGVSLAAWSSWYYGPTLWMVLVLWLLMRLPWREIRAFLAVWPVALVAPLVTLALLAPYAQPTLQTLRGGDVRHDYASLLLLSAHPLDYVAPSRYHALWGGWAAQVAPETVGERLVAPGFALLVLAGVGMWRWRRSKVAWSLLGVAMVCFVLSLGPELRIGEQTIPLPALLAYEHVPVLRSIRAWSRMAFYAQICIALLAALSLTGFPQWRRVWQIAGVIVIGGVLLESAHAAPSVWRTSTEPRPVDSWLATQPGSGATLQVPDLFSGSVEYYTLFSRRPSLTGYGTFVPENALADISPLRFFPSQRMLTTVRRLGGEYILVRRDLMDRELPGWRERAMRYPELVQVYEDEAMVVYRLLPLGAVP